MLTGRQDQNEAGFTLVEMLVVTAILTIIGGIVGSTIIASFQTSRRAEARVHSLNDLEKTVQRIGREIRMADPLLPDPDGNIGFELGAELYRNGQLQVYRYELVDGDLLQHLTVLNPSDRSVLNGPTTSVVIRDVANDAGTPLFTYFDTDYEDVDGDGEDDPMVWDCDATDPGPCIARFSIASHVRLTVIKELAEQDDQQVQTIITRRNP